jgi:hypothetical protein
MTDETNTDTVSTETILEAANIPQHASIHDLGWDEKSNLNIEWSVEE